MLECKIQINDAPDLNSQSQPMSANGTKATIKPENKKYE